MQFWSSAPGIGGKSRLAPRSFVKDYAGIADYALKAEQVGFDAFSSGEHHFMYNGFNNYSLFAVAVGAAKTKTIGLNVGCLLLPLHDPLRVAQDMAVVDVTSRGRLSGSFGIGYRPMEFTGFGVNKKTRGARIVEAMQVIDLALNNEVFSYEGKFFRYQNVRLRPRPVQRPFPKLWLFGGTSDIAARRAGRYGFNYEVAIVPLWKAKQCLDVFYQTAREYGHDTSQLKVANVKQMILGRTAEEAERKRAAMLESFEEHILAYGYLVDEKGEHVYNPPKDHPVYQQMFEGVFCGTPEQAVEHLREYEKAGLYAISGGGIAEELFTKQVLPHFKQR